MKDRRLTDIKSVQVFSCVFFILIQETSVQVSKVK